jgi:pimeloyl-ACP methyl ester carboxylesterase
MAEAALPIWHFEGRDGADLVYREMGPEPGRPLVLLHGYLSNATTNWVRYGHAAALAELGYRVVMPDLRAHGDSARSHAAADYPSDVLADDGLALLEHLGLGSSGFDLGGYSLGGRTVVRMLVRGAEPGRAVVAGMGLNGILRASEGGDRYKHILTNASSFKRGSPEWMVEAFLNTTGGDPLALVHIVDTAVDTPAETLRSLVTPTLVIRGNQDTEQASARELAGTLPGGHYIEIPGTHMNAVTKPDLGRVIGEFLGPAVRLDPR